MHNRRGVSLLELIVTMVVLAIAATVVSIWRASDVAPDPADPRALIAVARRTAIERGEAQQVDVTIGEVRHTVTLLPNGGIVADTALAYDRLTGRPRHAHR